MERLENSPDYPQILKANRIAILERLDWESSSPEVPNSIRGPLVRTKKFIEGRKWTDKESFNLASKRWHDMQGFIMKGVGRNDDLQADQIYFIRNLALVDREYKASGGK